MSRPAANGPSTKTPRQVWGNLAKAIAPVFCAVALGCSGSGADSDGGTPDAGSGGTSAEAGADAGSMFSFTPIQALGAPPDVTTDRLCVEAADPDNAPDTTFIDCRLEADVLVDEPPAPKDELLVMAYNIERGLKLDRQIAGFRDGTLPMPDVLLVSEADRGCSRTNDRDVTRDLAVALNMNYVFAVEFIELPRQGGGGGEILETCEHGNAILSPYPLGNVGIIRHAENLSWYVPPDERQGQDGEPRLGGRVTLYADVLVGERWLHTYVLHFESEIFALPTQNAQAAEAADHGLGQPGRVIQGGDTNAGLYVLDLSAGTTQDKTVQAYVERGYLDTHASLPNDARGTRGGLVIDLIFADGDYTSDPGICPAEQCGDLSDHLPIWATVALD